MLNNNLIKLFDFLNDDKINRNKKIFQNLMARVFKDVGRELKIGKDSYNIEFEVDGVSVATFMSDNLYLDFSELFELKNSGRIVYCDMQNFRTWKPKNYLKLNEFILETDDVINKFKEISKIPIKKELLRLHKKVPDYCYEDDIGYSVTLP